MKEPLRIGIAGLGTVGVGVIKMLESNADVIAKRAGRKIAVVAVSARDRARDRGVDLSPYQWMDDARDLARHEKLDVVVELIGGTQGTGAQLIYDALKNKKHVVSANKALIAQHGFELAMMAEQNDVCLKYEAAVAGGIPIIKVMRESFADNVFHAVYGILNEIKCING